MTRPWLPFLLCAALLPAAAASPTRPPTAPRHAEVEWIRTPRAPAVPPGSVQAPPADAAALRALHAEAASDWTIALEDQTFHQTLRRWARTAGWQLVWEAERDFAIDAQVTLRGNFLQVLDQAMASLRETDFPVQARINADTRVVRVVRYRLDGDRQ